MTVVAELPQLDESQRISKPCPVWLLFLIGGLLGLGPYFAIGFNLTLRPHHIDWLLHFTDKEPYWDPGTYFLGWHYFRHAPWTLPPGANPDYGMEFGGAIVYSDSVSVMAFILKPFTRYLGPVFQYQGIWILLCFLLQGAFGSLLASRFVRYLVPNLLIAAFFVISPVLLERGWNQYAHMGQFLLLWALYLYLGDRRGEIRWAWVIPVMLAVTTSFYYVPMILAIWFADVLKAWLVQGRRLRSISLEVVMIFCVLLGTMWAAGYFTIAVADAQTLDFGKFSTNLLGLIDPWDFSLFLQKAPKSPYWLGEGYCYLGLGMLLLGGSAIVELFKTPPSRQIVIRALPLIAPVAFLALFSLSNRIAFGAHVADLPNFWWKLGPIFRATGRMIWPAFYAIWTGIFYMTVRYLRPGKAAVVLAVALAIQIADLSPMVRYLHEFYNMPLGWRTPLRDPFWTSAVHKYRRIAVIPSGYPFHYAPIALLGASNGIPTNAVSLARFPAPVVIDAVTNSRIQAMREDKPDRDTLYIVPLDDLFRNFKQNLTHEHGVGTINGYNVIAPFWFADDHPDARGGLEPARGK